MHHIKTALIPPVVALLHCFLFASLVQSAPISSPAFKEAANRAKTLVEKILRDIPAAHSATVSTEVNAHLRLPGSCQRLLPVILTASRLPQGFTLGPSSQISNLQLMVTSMGIPAAPVLKPLSERFTPVSLQSEGLWGVFGLELYGVDSSMRRIQVTESSCWVTQGSVSHWVNMEVVHDLLEVLGCFRKHLQVILWRL